MKKRKLNRAVGKARSSASKAMKSPMLPLIGGAAVGGVAPSFISSVMPSSTAVPKNLVSVALLAVEYMLSRNPKFAPFAKAAMAGTIGALAMNVKNNGVMNRPSLTPAMLTKLRQGVRHLGRPSEVMGRPSQVMGRPSQVMGEPSLRFVTPNRAW